MPCAPRSTMATLQFLRYLALALCYIPGWITAVSAQHATTEHTDHGRNELALLVGHTHVSQGVDAQGGQRWLVLPSWCLNYNRWLGAKWAIGVHADIIIETFVVQDHLRSGGGEGTLERTRPIAPALMLTWRPQHHWSFLLGGGCEFAREEDLLLARAAAEFTTPIHGAWELVASLAYDFRFDTYDSYTLGVGVSWRF